jgi:hypothetical protein
MPATPKPPGTHRRCSQAPSTRTLPAEGRTEKVRALPSRKPAWSKQTRTWWADVWRSPSATQWGEADFDVVVRLARLHEAILEEPGVAALHAAASALEDRLAAASEARPPVPTRELELGVGVCGGTRRPSSSPLPRTPSGELVHVRERTSRTRNGAAP